MSENEKTPEDGEAERDPVFYYSREHRLSRASKTVRALNEGENVRPSLRTLFGAKGNIFILMSILVICVMFGITSRLSSSGSSVKLGANTLNLNIIREEEVLALSILKTAPKSGEFYIGAVDIAVSPVLPNAGEGETQRETPRFSHRVFFNPTETEPFFMSLPFDGDDFYVFLSTDDEQKVVRIK